MIRKFAWITRVPNLLVVERFVLTGQTTAASHEPKAVTGT